MHDPLTRLLQRRLAQGRDWLLVAGAGLAAPDAAIATLPGARRLDEAGALARHRAALAEGADILLTASAGLNGAQLRRMGGGEVACRNRQAAELARQALRDSAEAGGNRDVLLAGQLGPTGQVLAPQGWLSPAEAANLYQEQALALAAGGAEILWLGGFSDLAELAAAIAGARRSGLGLVLTLAFGRGGRSLHGAAPAQLLRLGAGLAPPALALGAQSAAQIAAAADPGADQAAAVRALLSFAAAGAEGLLIACADPSPGAAEDHDFPSENAQPQEQAADFARLAYDAGARILGPGALARPGDLAAMRAALLAHRPGARPAPELIAAKLATA